MIVVYKQHEPYLYGMYLNKEENMHTFEYNKETKEIVMDDLSLTRDEIKEMDYLTCLAHIEIWMSSKERNYEDKN